MTNYQLHSENIPGRWVEHEGKKHRWLGGTYMLTALTPATKENGSLQMIHGSHKMWRVEHGFSGEQVGADMEKVNEALKIMPLDYLEMDFGDTAFFHCNTLHASAAKLSDKPRWSIITAYNLACNKPYKDVHASGYTPINPFKGDLLTQDAISITDDAEFLIK